MLFFLRVSRTLQDWLFLRLNHLTKIHDLYTSLELPRTLQDTTHNTQYTPHTTHRETTRYYEHPTFYFDLLYHYFLSCIFWKNCLTIKKKTYISSHPIDTYVLIWRSSTVSWRIILYTKEVLSNSFLASLSIYLSLRVMFIPFDPIQSNLIWSDSIR